MAASVDYNIIGASPPFTFSVKDSNGIERFESIGGGKIYFTAPNNGVYTVKITKGSCVISNQVIINNCTTPTPTLTPTISCTAPILSLVSVVSGTNATFNVGNITGCTSLEFEYSLDSSFVTYSSVFSQCLSTVNLTFPSEDIYYVRVAKFCNSIKVYSNVISVNLKSNNCFTYAACLGIGNDPDYDTYRITLKEPASENIQFLLSNGSIITVYKGETYGQEIINVTQNCPYIVSNSVNLKYCGIVVPTTPVTPVTPVNSCTKVYAINNSSQVDIITFTLCTLEEKSYTLQPYSASPEVCIINENAWVSNVGQITIYNRGNC